jgi:heme-degrading monooxygenase HmoA
MSAFKTVPISKTELHASGSKSKHMVARIWRGQTKASDAVEYQRYLYENGVLKIEHMPGNLGVLMYQTQKDGIAEFTVMSFWPDRQSISSWSGNDLTRTRHLERDPEFLLSLPDKVELVDVIANDWQLPRAL